MRDNKRFLFPLSSIDPKMLAIIICPFRNAMPTHYFNPAVEHKLTDK
jgi:hypothetical protein